VKKDRGVERGRHRPSHTFGRHGLTLDSEYGIALGGGRMASLFAHALFAEGGNNTVLGGVRLQRDKTLICISRNSI
jgi:hypothetical protein